MAENLNPVLNNIGVHVSVTPEENQGGNLVTRNIW